MKPPFVGIAHSMGCAHLANLALIHPRLFHSLVLIDPVIVDAHPPGPNAALASSLRREKWDSRTKAEAGFKKNPLFKSFDPRVVEAFLAHGLTNADDGSVHLTTPKAQEAWSFARSNFHAIPDDTTSLQSRYWERLINPDFLPFEDGGLESFGRGDSLQVFNALPQLRPRTFYLYGKHSHINPPNQRKRLIEMTGVGRGGSGGPREGATVMKVIDETSHFICFESPQKAASEISDWLAKETIRWEAEKRFWARLDTRKSKINMKQLSEKWVEMVKRGGRGVPRPSRKSAAKL